MIHRTAKLTSLVLGLILVLAACTPRNQAPQVNITSPQAGETVNELESVTLAAEASDPDTGDAIDEIEWSSDIDGNLTPDVNGEVMLSPGEHTLTATASDASGIAGSDTVEVTVTHVTAVVSDGLNLRLISVDDGTIEELDSDTIPAEGLLEGHQIFNIVSHPEQPWLYVASSNECGFGGEWCWGNARIDRFVVDGDTLIYDGAALVYDETQTEIDCAQVDSGYEGQVGTCQPNGMVFSSDASRFYVDDDDYDNVQAFSVDENGDLTFLDQGAGTEAHGLAISDDDQYLYNGTIVIDVSTDTPTGLSVGTGGNSTTIVDLDDEQRLVTTELTDGVGVYDLTDPEAPVAIDQEFMAENDARDIDFTDSLDRIIAVGQDIVHSLSFDGEALTIDDTFQPNGATVTEYRNVTLLPGGEYAMASFFTQPVDGDQSGGVELISIAEDGTLEFVDRLELEEEARVVFGLQ